MGEAIEGLGQLLKPEYLIHLGACAGAREQGQDLSPSRSALRVGPGADGYPAEADAAEEQCGRIEARDRAGQTSNNADAA